VPCACLDFTAPEVDCAYCGERTQGNFTIHRDGFNKGPEVHLCNACGGSAFPTLKEIWAKISKA
jgi:hypothetical protein